MGLRKNILGSWGERSFFFQGAESKDAPGGLCIHIHVLSKVRVTGWPPLGKLLYT